MQMVFIRHGESEANAQYIFSNRGFKHGLTTKGRQQAAALVDKLRDFNPVMIYTSPLLRAFQTADILCSALGISLRVRNALREFDVGALEEKSDANSWGQFKALLEDWLVHKKWEARIDQGESFLDIKMRFVPFIENLIAEYSGSDSTILLVGHGGTFRVMFPLIFDNIDFPFILEHHLGNTEFVAASLQGTKLVCTQWGDKIL